MRLPRYADIAVPTVPKDTLTYGIPEGLREAVQVGMRVVVPLGRRLLMGFVLGVHDEAPDFAVKALQQVLDPEPVFPPDILQLCSWMHRYYCCTPGDALKAALPQGMDIDSERYVSLHCDDDLMIARAIGKSRIKQSIVDALRTGEVLTEEQLRATAGTAGISAQLRDLMMEGIVRVESVVERPAARPRTVLAARLLPEWRDEARFAELLDMLEKRAPKQVNILTVLWQAWQRGERSMVVAELARQAHASTAQVRALEDKEILEVYEEEMVREFVSRYEERPKAITLNEDQRAALVAIRDAVDAGGFVPQLLYGVTGSGKTQVYIEAIQHVLAKGRTALVLLPEINLTPQLVARFRLAFGSKVTVLHSRMSQGERYDSWRLTLRGDYSVVVGVRSAVFAPLRNLGIIVVDEEHDSSYKQSDTDPRYHGRDAAVMRAAQAGIPVLLGSATPSAESWYNAELGKYRVLQLPRRVDDARLPDIRCINMSEARRQRRTRGALSVELLDLLSERIARNEAAIVFHNRRGYAPWLECNDCGYVAQCEHCSISLTYHKDKSVLRCHYCGYSLRLPDVCPECGGTELESIGAGTQRVEEDVAEQLPQARILRMDADSTRRKGTHDLMLTSFAGGEYDILLGTQMVAKGLDFDRVTLVGVVAAEQSLLLPDFRSTERTMQMLTQVAGRAGRGRAPGLVVIQATQPEHQVFDDVQRHDYAGFMRRELESRKALSYPPYTRLVRVLFASEDEQRTLQAATTWHHVLRAYPKYYILNAPQPAVIARINRHYRYQLVLRVHKALDPDGAVLRELFRRAQEQYIRTATGKPVAAIIDIDPQQLM